MCAAHDVPTVRTRADLPNQRSILAFFHSTFYILPLTLLQEGQAIFGGFQTALVLGELVQTLIRPQELCLFRDFQLWVIRTNKIESFGPPN